MTRMSWTNLFLKKKRTTPKNSIISSVRRRECFRIVEEMDQIIEGQIHTEL